MDLGGDLEEGFIVFDRAQRKGMTRKHAIPEREVAVAPGDDLHAVGKQLRRERQCPVDVTNSQVVGSVGPDQSLAALGKVLRDEKIGIVVDVGCLALVDLDDGDMALLNAGPRLQNISEIGGDDAAGLPIDGLLPLPVDACGVQRDGPPVRGDGPAQMAVVGHRDNGARVRVETVDASGYCLCTDEGASRLHGDEDVVVLGAQIAQAPAGLERHAVQCVLPAGTGLAKDRRAQAPGDAGDLVVVRHDDYAGRMPRRRQGFQDVSDQRRVGEQENVLSGQAARSAAGRHQKPAALGCDRCQFYPQACR